MAACSTTALRKYLTRHSNLGQPLREKAVSTTRAHAEGETLINSGRYRRPLFKSSLGRVYHLCVPPSSLIRRPGWVGPVIGAATIQQMLVSKTRRRRSNSQLKPKLLIH